jgi:hypothetical protein
VTILIVTHNMQQAARVSDYTAYMYLGEMIEFGKTDDIFIKPQATSAPKTTSPAAWAKGDDMNEKHLSSQFDDDLTVCAPTYWKWAAGRSPDPCSHRRLQFWRYGSVKDIVEADHRVNGFEKIIDDDCIHVHRQAPADGLRPAPGDRHHQDRHRPGTHRRRGKENRQGRPSHHEQGQLPCRVRPIGPSIADEAGAMLVRQALDCLCPPRRG